jgi:hypothetical protein
MNETRDTRYLLPILTSGGALELTKEGMLSSNDLFVRGNSIENGFILDVGGLNRFASGFNGFLKV